MCRTSESLAGADPHVVIHRIDDGIEGNLFRRRVGVQHGIDPQPQRCVDTVNDNVRIRASETL